MGLIELVRGMATSDETFEASQRLAAHLGKTTCVSQVCGSAQSTGRSESCLAYIGADLHALGCKGLMLAGTSASTQHVLPPALHIICAGPARVHRQSHPDAHDQRSLLCAHGGTRGGCGNRVDGGWVGEWTRVFAAGLDAQARVGMSAAQPAFGGSLYPPRRWPYATDTTTTLQGVGSAHDIDTGMKLGTNQPMGPLALAGAAWEQEGWDWDMCGRHVFVAICCQPHAPVFVPNAAAESLVKPTLRPVSMMVRFKAPTTSAVLTCRPDWVGHVPGGDAGAARRAGGEQVPVSCAACL